MSGAAKSLPAPFIQRGHRAGRFALWPDGRFALFWSLSNRYAVPVVGMLDAPGRR